MKSILTLPEAAALVGVDEAALLDALQAGHVTAHGRVGVDAYAIRPCDWRAADVHWPTSRISTPSGLFHDSPVEVDRASLLGHFGHPKGAKVPTGGRPAKWDWEAAAIDIFAVVYHGGELEPQRLADVERLLAEWFLDNARDTPSESEIRRHASKLFRGFQKAGN